MNANCRPGFQSEVLSRATDGAIRAFHENPKDRIRRQLDWRPSYMLEDFLRESIRQTGIPPAVDQILDHIDGETPMGWVCRRPGK